jgi:predicted ATPase
MYRISLTGAQGTGKSTLARAIATQLRIDGIVGVQACSGVGDQVTLAGFATGARAGVDAVRRFAQLHQAREAAATGSVLVFDRCLLDTLAYAEVLDCMSGADFDSLRDAAVVSCRRFAQLLWLRVTHDYPVLTPSDETPEFRRAIDAAIGRLARDNAITLFEYAMPPQQIDDIVEAVLARQRKDLAIDPNRTVGAPL